MAARSTSAGEPGRTERSTVHQSDDRGPLEEIVDSIHWLRLDPMLRPRTVVPGRFDSGCAGADDLPWGAALIGTAPVTSPTLISGSASLTRRSSRTRPQPVPREPCSPVDGCAPAQPWTS